MSFSNSPYSPYIADPFNRASTGGSPFSGLPPATLQCFLDQSVAALQQLLTGSKPVTVSYGMGDGQKSVTYQRTDETKLRMHINELRQLLGQGGRRAPVRVGF
jgi:hypothetical protein